MINMLQNQYYRLWYVRRAGELQGPFPALQIRKFAVVGRLHDGDELSMDREHWFSFNEGLQQIPQDRMSPAAMIDANVELIVKMREDERSGVDRRDQQMPTQEQLERRSGKERRGDEDTDVMQHRLRKTDFLNTTRSISERYRTVLLAATLVAVAVLAFGYIHLNGNGHGRVDCQATPASGIDFSYCDFSGATMTDRDLSGAIFRNTNLGGADLRENNLSAADFSYANLEYSSVTGSNLTAAILTGANLRDSEFNNVQLDHANLTYADLTGASLVDASLHGTDFSFAVWSNGQVCQANSIGRCRLRESTHP